MRWERTTSSDRVGGSPGTIHAQVPPVDDRIKATKMFIEIDSVGGTSKEEEALEDGLKRLFF